MRKIIGFILVCLFSTWVMATEPQPAPTAEQSKQYNEETFAKLETFAKVLGYLEENYIDYVDNTKLIELAIKGMVKKLDPHTVYLTKDEYAQMKVETSGKFGGIGIEVGMNENKELYVVKPMRKGPAFGKGVKAGDRILEVNGTSTKGWSIDDAVEKLRGNKGTEVKLKLIHENTTDPFVVKMTRMTIYLQSVVYKVLRDEYGYIQVKSFQESTEKDVLDAYKAISKTLSKNKRSLKGLILDLRNNPGGLLDQAIKVTDLFVEKGVIVSTKGRLDTQVEINYAKKEGTLPYMPMAVLINDGTASASEIVSGALQDHLRATLIGTRTFGKGSVQSIIDLDDGSGLKMTVARYYTPKDRPIQNLGNQPDLFVSYFNYRPEDEFFRSEQSLERSLDTVELQAKKPKKGKTEHKEQSSVLRDSQLKAALEYLQVNNRMKIGKQQTLEKK